MDIQEKLCLLQEISGRTQTELAKEIGVSFVAFNNWWTGKAVPRTSALQKIANLLASYGVVSDVNQSASLAKKELVVSLSKKHKNILKKLLSRTDLVDELSLQITYNSNAIEGSTLSVEDTANIIFENKTLRNKTVNEQLEAKNHDKAFRYLLAYLAKGKVISESLAKELHRILMAGIRDDAGSYRFHPVRIVGSYVPTANYMKVPDLMKKLFAKKALLDAIIFSADFHAKFEQIHPFGDGNGRTGRLILIGQLLERNIAPAIITKKTRKAYYHSLKRAQLDEIFDPIREYICDSIIRGIESWSMRNKNIELDKLSDQDLRAMGEKAKLAKDEVGQEELEEIRKKHGVK